jgi:hypothetical protein
VEQSSVAVIDERKAMRICAERYATVRLASSVEVVLHPLVERALGRDSLADAVYRAMRLGRMRGVARHVDLVVALIGPARATECTIFSQRWAGGFGEIER